MERTWPVARAVLARVGGLSEDEQIDWARQQLYAAGVHAETLRLILDLDVDPQS